MDMENGMELEEVVIPTSNNTADDDQLDDVIPCEPVDFGEQEMMEDAPAFSGSDNLYSDELPVTSSVAVTDMVDIAPHVEGHLENELEEDFIPISDNMAVDNELDDVVAA